MSFIQSICGPATSNEFVFSTSNVSSDNASFINLSVLGDATIVTLSTTNFSPTTLDAQVLTAVNGTIATFQSTSSYISNLSVSSMSVDNLSVGEVDITLLDVETIEVDTLKIMDTVTVNYGQVVRASDIMTIAGGYVDPADPLVTYPGEINLTSGAPGGNRAINISLDKANISGNVIDAITTNSVSVNASDLYSDSVTAIDVDADEGNFGTVNTPFLNVSTLGVSDIVTENISVINASVNNLSVYNTLDIKDRDGSNHHGSIYNDTTGLHIAGNGELIRIRSGGAFDEIVVTKTQGRVNISNLNTSTITGIDVTLTGTMDATTVIANDINTPLLNASNISIDEDISCEQIVCADVICNDVTTNFLFDVDLTNNLSAGQGITITSVDSVAVISATTTITDPLNISKLNASNISVDVNVSVAGSFTCNDAQIDDLFNCDMTNTLRGGTSGLDIPFDNISVEFATGTQDTIVMLKPDIVLYNISLLPNILTLAPPTFEMTAGTAQITNANMSNLSVNHLSVINDISVPSAIITDVTTNGISLVPDQSATPPTFEMTTGTAQITNANMSNLSVNNLSVLTDITTPSATITDLTIPAAGTLNHDFSKNFTAGTGINITHVGDQVTIAATGGSVTDPLNLSKLNVSNISVDEGITTDTITCDLTPNLTAGAGVTITSVGNKPTITAVNSVTANVPVSDFIETLQIIPSGTRPFLTQGINQMSIDVNVHDYQGGTAYSPSNMFTVYAGDKIVFNWKQSGWKQTSPAELSFICYLVSGVGPATSTNRIPVGRIYQYIYPQSDHEEISGTFVYNVSSTFSFYRSQIEGTGGMVTQGNDYGAATATVYRASVPNSIVVPNLIDATNISVDNLSISGDTDMIGKLTVGNIEFKNIGSTAVVSYLQTNMPSMKWFLNKTMDFRKDDDAGIVFMKLDHSVGNVNISNLSSANVSAENISTTFFSTTQIRLKDPADPATTKGSIFCNPNAFQFFGPDFRFINNTVVPNTDYMRMDQTRSNVNISNLSTTNTSILNDMTITRDLDVDRYLSYKPRFLTRWRDNVYSITGTAQDVQWNRDETAMAGGALQVSGDGIQALLAGWYRVDWSIGYRKINNDGGERLTARTYLRINNIFYGKYGYGSSTYLRSSSINRIGFSSGSQLVYANVNDIIHVRTDCIIQANVDFTSDFGGQRILANSRFSCEYVSNSGET